MSKPQPARDIDVLTKPDTSKQGWKERLDTLEIGYYSATGYHYTQFKDHHSPELWNSNGNKIIKSFIQQEIDRAVEAERKRCLAVWNEIGSLLPLVPSHKSYEETYQEIRSKIEKGEHE